MPTSQLEQTLSDDPGPVSRPTWWRLGLLAVVLGGLLLIGAATGIASDLEPEQLRTLLASAGLCGVLGFFAAFTAGNLLQLPGMAFVTAGVLIYGQVAGSLMALTAAVIAVSVTFFVVRTVGGKPLAAARRPIVRKLLDRLDARPVRTIVVLRTLFQTSPALNVALALSRVRYRDYLIGSVVGLVLPVTAVALIAALAGL